MVMLSRKSMVGANGNLPDPTPILYINTVSGSDAANGLTPATAKASLSSAVNLLSASYSNMGTIKVHSTETVPLNIGNYNISLSGRMVIDAYDEDEKWYGLAGYILTGWTSEGNGIYSRAFNAQGAYIWVVGLTDGNGYDQYLSFVSSTTTPDAGRYSWVSGSPNKLYLHLPGDLDPNSYSIELAALARGIVAKSTLNLTLRRGCMSGASGEGAAQFDENSVGKLIDCEFRRTFSGLDARGSSKVTCIDCLGENCQNDGFDVRGSALLTLNNCESRYNRDEGCSPHQDSTLYIIGGRYHHNYSSGMTAANNAVCRISGGVIFDYNNQAPPSGESPFGGITFGSASSGNINGAISRNNSGPGYYNISTGSVDVADLTSGLEQGNGAADTY